MTTPKAITFIVVGTLSMMSLLYIGTLAYCVVANVTPSETMGRSFESAGIYVLGAFTGILVNTRTQHPEDARPNSITNIRTNSDSAADPNSVAVTITQPNAGSDSAAKSNTTSISTSSA